MARISSSLHDRRPVVTAGARAGLSNMAFLCMTTVLVVLAMMPETAAAFYIPGATPTYYKAGDEVQFWVNSIRSTSVMFPKDYYRMPFCRPKNIVRKHDSIGELIWGDRQASSLYQVKMAQNTSCRSLLPCDIEANTKEIKDRELMFRKHIQTGFRGFMNIDNLPVFTTGTQPLPCGAEKARQGVLERGYALGVPSACTGETLINNHLHFMIDYNVRPGSDVSWDEWGTKEGLEFMVVGLRVTPYSVANNGPDVCTESFVLPTVTTERLRLSEVTNGTQQMHWTYSVEWHQSDIRWATRWDAYFASSTAGSSDSVHYLTMAAGLLIVVIVSGAVASILARALRKDIVRYNSLSPEELQEETGWKLIHADVFRPPDRAGLMCILFGNGAQILCIGAGVVLLSAIGMLSPSRRGSLVIAVLMLAVFTALAEGYACGFMQRYLNCKSWRDVVLSGCCLQGVVCGVYLFTVIIGKLHDSTTAVPFRVIVFIFCFWLMVSLPLTVVGASFAFHQEPLKNPLQVGRLAREIPVQPFLNSALFLFFVPALFPLTAVLMEVHFMMQALWAGQVYYVFGFLAVSGVLWAIVVALVTVSQIYYVLCYENHQWWWIAFVAPGGLGFHLFVYAIYFYTSQLTMASSASTMLYFLYMGIISWGYGIAAGTIGLAAAIAFTRYIYGSIKVD